MDAQRNYEDACVEIASIDLSICKLRERLHAANRALTAAGISRREAVERRDRALAVLRAARDPGDAVRLACGGAE